MPADPAKWATCVRLAGLLAEAGVQELIVMEGRTAGAVRPSLSGEPTGGSGAPSHSGPADQRPPHRRLRARVTDLPRVLYELPPGSEVAASDRSMVVKVTAAGLVLERGDG